MFSQTLTNQGIKLHLNQDKTGTGRKNYSAGLDVDQGYAVAELARREGYQIKTGISSYNGATVTLTVYASDRERFYLKIYAANANQAEAIADELAVIAAPHLEHQMELALS